MTAMNPNQTRGRGLRDDVVSFTEEARRIQSKALGGEMCVVRLGRIVVFSTEAGDACMLDPEDGYAVCLARDFEPRCIPIQETPAKLAIRLLNSVYDWQDADRKGRKSASRNLLDYLRPKIRCLHCSGHIWGVIERGMRIDNPSVPC